MPIPMGKGPHGGFPYASHCQISWPINAFLKVLGILKPFFQEGFKRGSGAEPLVPHKLQFEIMKNPNQHSIGTSFPINGTFTKSRGLWRMM